MTRPLMQHGVAQLEQMFGECKADLKQLKRLEDELQCRQVPRAVALLVKVRSAIRNVSLALSPIDPEKPTQQIAPVIKQGDMFSRPLEITASSSLTIVPVQQVVVPTTHVKLTAPINQSPPTVQAMTAEDAHQLLKGTPGSTWEAIEQTRQLLVQQSHPVRISRLEPELRVQALAAAERVNTAYLALSQLRCKGC